MSCRSAIVALPLALALCAGGTGVAVAQDGSSTAVPPQTPASQNPLGAALAAVGFGHAKPADMPDFVTRSRPPEDQLHFIPVGSRRPEPASRPLTRAEIESEEASLANLRDRDHQRAGQKLVAVKVNSAAGAPFVPKKKAKPTCRITCKIELMKVGK